jgi:hypothetical protein
MGFYLLSALVVAYDLITRIQVHPVYRCLVPVLAIVPLIVTGIYRSEWWPPLARQIARI